MKIGVDISSVNPKKAGIGQYTSSLAKALWQVDKENSYFFFTNDSKNAEELSQLGLKIVEIKYSRPGFWWIRKTAKYLGENNFDLLISPTNFSFGLMFEHTIQIVHDIAPIKRPEFFSLKSRLMFKFLFNLMAPRVKTIVVPTEDVRNEINNYFKGIESKLKIVGEGLHEWVFKEKDEKKAEAIKIKYSLPDKYILTIGTLEPRKNHINMIKAFAKLSDSEVVLKYVIVGKKGWYFDEIFQTVRELKLENKVVFLGYIPDEELPYIIDQSKGFVYCSFYEGFGLPCIEAYSRGVPVLTSNIKVMKEVMEEYAIYANPNDVEDISKKIQVILTFPPFKPSTSLMSKFSWIDTAKRFVSLI